MRAQHITFNKAIKTVKILKNFYCKILTVLMAFVKSYMLGSRIYHKNSFSAWQISGNIYSS